MSTSNRIDLGKGRLLQLERRDYGYELRLLENRTFITPKLALSTDDFDLLMRSAGVVDLGWLKMQRYDRQLWICRDGKLWAEVSWAKVWALAQAV